MQEEEEIGCRRVLKFRVTEIKTGNTTTTTPPDGWIFKDFSRLSSIPANNTEDTFL